MDKGDTVAVVGDGAVGLSAVLASKRLGAERILALSRNPIRQQVAHEFGVTDILAERGDDAIAAVLELTDGIGVDAALECVGTGQSMATALAVSRPGSTVGVVGAPHGVDVPFESNFWRSVGWQGGVAPARWYIPELLDDVLSGAMNPAVSSTTRPASTGSPTPTRRWMSDVRSSRSFAWGRSDGHLD